MGTGVLCGGCSLEQIGKGFVPLEWTPSSFRGLLIIGEAAGEQEARESKPFVPWGQSGSLLAQSMRHVGIGRSEVAIINCISCHPPKDWLVGAPWEYKALGQCTSSYLQQAIELVQPQAILAVGSVAFSQLAMRPSGKYGGLDYARGYVLPGAGVAIGIPVIPTYHPAFIRRGAAHLTSLLRRDIWRAFMVAQGKLKSGVHYSLDPAELNLRYQMHISVEEAWEWAKAIDPELPLYWDCETPRSTRSDEDERVISFTDRDIKLFQATQRRGEGIAIPYRKGFVEVIQFIMNSNTLKVGQNVWNFDEPVFKSNDIEINLEKGSDDVMVMFGRVEPDLPANLQAVAQYCGFPFPWKALGESDIEFYGVCDVDALAWCYPVLKSVMEREGTWEAYVNYIRRVHPIFSRMTERGFPIDESKRLELKALLVMEGLKIDGQIRELVPEEVLSQKQKNGYKNPPILSCEDCDYKGRGDHICTDVMVVPFSQLAEAHGLVLRQVTLIEPEKCRCTKKMRPACDVCRGSGIIPAGVEEFRWAALTEFNPNSSHQVRRFVRFLKHPVPKHAKRTDAITGEASETTEVKELERLFAKTRHPIYRLLIEKRQISKLLGTFVEGWAPGKDGRIHSTIGHKATWQPSAKSPNIFNGIKRGRTSEQKARVKAFNAMQQAENGHVLVNLDLKSFHAQTMACEVGNADYLRLTKIDQHSFTTCHFIKHPERHNLLKFSDGDLKAFFVEMKGDKVARYKGPSGLMTFREVRDGKTKSAGLGIGFGMQGRKLYQMYQEDFANEAEAKAISNLIRCELFEGAIGKWQERVKAQAAEDGLLMSKYGAIRRFYDVERWNPSMQKMMGGDQAEAAIAFLPANHAFGYMRDVYLRLEEEGLLERFEMVNSVYDSIQIHPLEGEAGEAIRLIVPIMEAPSKVLVYAKVAPLGLSVEAEASVGKNLAEMVEFG